MQGRTAYVAAPYGDASSPDSLDTQSLALIALTLSPVPPPAVSLLSKLAVFVAQGGAIGFGMYSSPRSNALATLALALYDRSRQSNEADAVSAEACELCPMCAVVA